MYDEDEEITPAGVMVAFWRWFWVVIGGMVVLLVVGTVLHFTLWNMGWWFGNQDVQRQFSQTVTSQQYQQGLTDQMSQHLANIRGVAVTRSVVPANSPEQATLRAQEMGELAALCEEAGRMTSRNPATPALRAIISANCSAGAAVVNPPVARPKVGP